MSTRNGTIVRWGLLALLAGALTAGPAVATDEATFNKLIAKVAPTFVSFGQKITPRVACACPNDGSSPVFAGFVLNNGGNIVCALPSFETPVELCSPSATATTSPCSDTNARPRRFARGVFLPDTQQPPPTARAGWSSREVVRQSSHQPAGN